MSAPIYQQNQVEDASARFLRDLAITPSTNKFSSNFYPEVNAYSLLKVESLEFLFIDLNKVVEVEFAMKFDIISAKHVFLFEGKSQEAQLTGYFALAFGLNSYSLIVITPENAGTKCYEVVKIIPYQNVQLDQRAEHVTSVVLIGEYVRNTRQGFAEQVIQFLLGVSSQQKTLQLNFSLSFKDQLMINHEEAVIYEEPKSFKSRISNYFTSKLGYIAGDGEIDVSKVVQDVYSCGPYAVIVTGKTIIIVETSAMVKVYETEYLDQAKQTILRLEQQEGIRLMRRELQFKLVASSISFIEESRQLQVNLFLLKEQDLQNIESYQTLRQTQIVYDPIVFTESNRKLEESGNRDLIFFDLDALVNTSEHPLQKTLALTYSYFSDQFSAVDVMQLLLLEFTNAKTLCIEYSNNERLSNINQLQTQRISGYSFENKEDESLREQIITVTLLTEQDIDVYRFDPTLKLMSQTKPVRAFANLEFAPEVIEQNSYRVPEMQYIEQPFQHQIQHSQPLTEQDLQQFIITNLDRIAQCRYPDLSKRRDQESLESFNLQMRQQITFDLHRALSGFSPPAIVEQTMNILRESMNVEVEDGYYSRQKYDEVENAFSDDGLISSSFESKQRKLDVISQFLNLNGLNEDSEQHQREINDLQVKLHTARLIKDYQNEVKQSLKEESTGFGDRKKYSAGIIFFTQVLQEAAMRMGFDQQKIDAKGSTCEYIAYSNISRVDELLDKLITLSVDPDFHHRIAQVDQFHVLCISGKILSRLLVSIREAFPEGMIRESGFLVRQLMFKIQRVCEKLTSVASDKRPEVQETLEALADSLINILIILNIDGIAQCVQKLTELIRDGSGPVKALAFARQYRCESLVCELVYDLGSSYYHVLQDCIRQWGREFLGYALHIVYQLEKTTLQNRKQAASRSQLQDYKGLQLFCMFEQEYYEPLAFFLRERNPKLLALLQLRNSQPEEANSLLRGFVIPKTTGVQTMKVLSSLAVSNLENCVQGIQREQKESDASYFERMLKRSWIQSQVLPNEPMLQEIDAEYLVNTYLYFSKLDSNNSAISNLRTIIDLLSFATYRQNLDHQTLQALKLVAWRLVVWSDFDQLKKIQKAKDPSNYIQNEDSQINNLVKWSHTFILGEENFGSRVFLDSEIQDLLLQEVPEEVKISLRTVYSYMKAATDQKNLFSQRPSIAQPSNFAGQDFSMSMSYNQ